jgi:hypothetical protein
MVDEKETEAPKPNTAFQDAVIASVRTTSVTHTFEPGNGINSAGISLTSRGERLTGYGVNAQGTVLTGTGSGTVNIGVTGTPQGDLNITGSLSQPNPNGSKTPTVTSVGVTETRNVVTEIRGGATGSLGGTTTGGVGITNNPRTGQTSINTNYDDGRGGTAAATVGTNNQYNVNVGYAKPIPAPEAGKPPTAAAGGYVNVGANNTAGLNTSAGFETRTPVGNNTVIGTKVDATYSATQNQGAITAGADITHSAGATTYRGAVNTTNGQFTSAIASIAQGGFNASLTARPGDRYDAAITYSTGNLAPAKPFDTAASARQISSTTENFRSTQKTTIETFNALSTEDQKLLSDAIKGVRKLNAAGANLPELETATAIAAKANKEGMTQIQEVSLGKANASGQQNIIIADDDSRNPATNKTSIDKNQAANTPIADSVQILRDTLNTVQNQSPASTQERAPRQ